MEKEQTPMSSRDNDNHVQKRSSHFSGSKIKNSIFETLQMMQDNNLDIYGSEIEGNTPNIKINH